MRIVQICEAVHYGDGVGNDILRKAELFRELGYFCDIYAKEIDQCLAGKAWPIEELVVQQGDILLHHYAGYSDLVDRIRDMPGVKVLIFHNITPPEMVKDEFRAGCEMGIRQLPYLRGQYDYYVGDSFYNVGDMEKYGLSASYEVLPIAIDFPIENSGVLLRQPKHRCSEGVSFLFVGRIARNKMQDVLLRVFDWYWGSFDRDARLTLVGDTGADPAYYQEVCELWNTLPSKKNIRMTGKVSDQDLRRIYEEADAYISLSRHEGFGLPLLEAMQYQIPVFAFRSAAVEETLGGAGVLLETDEPEQVAKILREVIEDSVRYDEIIRRQNAHIRSFLPEETKKKMQALVSKWSDDPLKTAEERAVYQRLSAAKDIVAQSTQSQEPVSADIRQESDIDIGRMRSLAENYAFRPLYSCRRYIGRFIVFGKRVVRKLLKWYLEPVCFQQTEFNLAVVDGVSRLHEEQAQVVQQLKDEQAQLAKLREERVQVVQQLREEQEQLEQQLREEQTQLEQQLREEQAQLEQQLREEQAHAVQQLREEQIHIAQRCTSVAQEDAYLAEQIQRMRNYLDRLDASGIPLFRPEQGTRWGDNKMSQDGTDTIVSSIVSLMNIPLDQVNYLDLGANHAIEFSSTYFFYKNGARGVLVEANPSLIPELQVLRSGDTVVSRAVTAKSGERIPFYVIPAGDGLSSTSETWVQNCLAQSENLGQVEEIHVDTITVNEIIEHYCEKTPVFVDLDIEGMELEILRTFDFQKYRPLVFAVEMIPFRPMQLVFNEKNKEIVALMEQNGYAEYAFTGINSIFVDRSRLEAGK